MAFPVIDFYIFISRLILCYLAWLYNRQNKRRHETRMDETSNRRNQNRRINPSFTSVSCPKKGSQLRHFGSHDKVHGCASFSDHFLFVSWTSSSPEVNLLCGLLRAKNVKRHRVIPTLSSLAKWCATTSIFLPIHDCITVRYNTTDCKMRFQLYNRNQVR